MFQNPDFCVASATIASGGTTSGSVDARYSRIFGVLLPAAMTGTAVAVHGALTQDGTYFPLVDQGGAAVSFTVTTSSLVVFDADLAANLSAVPWLKLVSNGTEGAERLIKIVMKG